MYMDCKGEKQKVNWKSGKRKNRKRERERTKKKCYLYLYEKRKLIIGEKDKAKIK